MFGCSHTHTPIHGPIIDWLLLLLPLLFSLECIASDLDLDVEYVDAVFAKYCMILMECLLVAIKLSTPSPTYLEHKHHHRQQQNSHHSNPPTRFFLDNVLLGIRMMPWPCAFLRHPVMTDVHPAIAIATATSCSCILFCCRPTKCETRKRKLAHLMRMECETLLPQRILQGISAIPKIIPTGAA